MDPADPRPEQMLTAQYASKLEDIDQEAIRVYLAVLDSGAAHRAAESRLFESLGTYRTQGRFAVLRALYFAPGNTLTQRDIRQDIRVTAPNVSQLISSMEREGQVRREVGQPDRRLTRVFLTEAGLRLADQMVPAMARLMTDSLEGFSEDEKARFHDFLTRFRANVERPLSTERIAEQLTAKTS